MSFLRLILEREKGREREREKREKKGDERGRKDTCEKAIV